MTGIAIIGVGCRFPGAASPASFWHNLREGVESIRFFSKEELRDAGIDEALLDRPDYVPAAPVLEDVDGFDAGFFGLSPQQARTMDPQQRLFLEVCWESMEDAGYLPDGSQDRLTGVFAGAGGVITSHLLAHAGHPLMQGDTGSLQHLGNDKDFLATRVSYHLGLEGPSLAVQSACSTSLVAVHLACRSLLDGECDMALAGASTVRVPQVTGYQVQKGDIRSPDGHCYAFDERAQGTIFGSGVGAVLLKPMDMALADGDHIYAVVLGSAVTNDGAKKVSYTASSVTGQGRAIVEALALADVESGSLGYVECHGTGTAMGDPLEIQALSRAFRGGGTRRQGCAIGSVKTNVGHLEQAAGIAGLIKAALALRHGEIPASLNFARPNPRINFAASPFHVAEQLTPWRKGQTPRRAGVNALGLGGTNAFVVLEEPPPRRGKSEAPDAAARPLSLLALSARDPRALEQLAGRFGDHLKGHPDISLADLCYTANVSRSGGSHRRALVAASTDELARELDRIADGDGDSAASEVNAGLVEPGPVAFLFTGQGAQRPGMGRDLYETEPVFREAMDQCATLLDPVLDPPLLQVLFSDGDAAGLLRRTDYTQPAMFALGYALARLWASWGVKPDLLMGHSVGEITAACVAGALPLEQALPFVARRGQLMAELPPGGRMASVFAAEDAVRAALEPLSDRVALAGINAPTEMVVSGHGDAVGDLLASLDEQGISWHELEVSHAFHSPAMDPMLPSLEEAAGAITGATPPKLPVVSNLTGELHKQCPTAMYWRDHARSPVLFMQGLETLSRAGVRTFIELGPGSTLLALGRRCHPEAEAASWLPSLDAARGSWPALLGSLRRLYLQGRTIDWEGFDKHTARRRISLPTYPFQNKPHRLPPAPEGSAGRILDGSSSHPLLGQRIPSPLEMIQIQAEVGLEQAPYLDDHRMYDLPVLPTAVALEVALAAGRIQLGKEDVQVRNLVHRRAMVLPEEGWRRAHLILTDVGERRCSFELASTEGAARDGWIEHLSGTLGLAQTGAPGEEQLELDKVTRRCDREQPVSNFYQAIRATGLCYGPCFRGIQSLRLGQGEALTRVQLPEGIDDHSSFALHPALLDACLHVYPALAPDAERLFSGQGEQVAWLPISVEQYRVLQPGATELRVHAVNRGADADGQGFSVDLHMYGPDNQPAAILLGLSLRRLPREALLPSSSDRYASWLYRLRWDRLEPLPAPAQLPEQLQEKEGADWLVLADEGGVGEALATRLRQQGARCQVVQQGDGLDLDALLPDQAVVHLWALDAPAHEETTFTRLEQAERDAVGSALDLARLLVQRRMDSGSAPRLHLVTRAATAPVDDAKKPSAVEPIQGELWGMGRTFALEHPRLWGGLVDLPPEADAPEEEAEALLAEVLGDSPEDQVALRSGERYGARLVRLEGGLTSSDEPALDLDGTYLITGGLGALGLLVARWLVEEGGVRHLAITSRGGAGGEAAEALAELEAMGASVEVIQTDITREQDVVALVEELAARPAPLAGVLHCAGMLDDVVVGRLGWEQFQRVTAPKVLGAWLLDRYTRPLDLSCFVLFSSVLSITGSGGQASYTAGNAYLDTLSEARRAAGLTTQSLNWGPWAEHGLATRSGSKGEAIWAARGTRYIPPADGVAIFGQALGADEPHLAVTITDWSRYLDQLPAPSALYTELAREVKPTRSRRGADREMEAMIAGLETTSGAEKVELMGRIVCGQVVDLLGLEEPVDQTRPLTELGLDSLMAVSLANKLEKALERDLPLVDLIRGPSITGLAIWLCSGQGPDTDEEGQQASPETPGPAGPGAGDWLVTIKPRPSAGLQLFCFPFAGGGSVAFHEWADLLGDTVEVVAVEPPGRLRRIDEDPIRDIDVFINALLPVLGQEIDRPYAFFGHCLGALTMYVAAHALMENGLPGPRQMFVSGARPPHHLRTFGPFEQTLLANLSVRPDFVRNLPVYQQPDEVFIEVIRHFNIELTAEMVADPELRGLMLPTVRAEFEMISNYTFMPRPAFDCPIYCFTGTEDGYVSRQNMLEWSLFTNSDFQVHNRPCGHFLMVEQRDYLLETMTRTIAAIATR